MSDSALDKLMQKEHDRREAIRKSKESADDKRFASMVDKLMSDLTGEVCDAIASDERLNVVWPPRQKGAGLIDQRLLLVVRQKYETNKLLTLVEVRRGATNEHYELVANSTVQKVKDGEVCQQFLHLLKTSLEVWKSIQARQAT